MPRGVRGYGTLGRVDDWRSDRIGSALRGENPMVLARMPGGFAVMGDVQWLPGYCILLTDDPHVTRLSELPRRTRMQYLDSLDRLAEAVEQSCAEADPAFRRVNIEILGNTDPFLHAHVWPRYNWETEEMIGRPVWLYPPERWSEHASELSEEQDALRARITSRLAAR